MSQKISAALAVTALLIAGCSSSQTESPGSPATASTPPPRSVPAETPPAIAEHALYVTPRTAPAEIPVGETRSSLLSIYLGVSTEPQTGFARQVLDAAAADLRERGYDVRGSATYPVANQQGTNFAPLLAQAVALNQGTAIAPTQRAATYLHVNSPRLILVASIESTPDTGLFGKPVQRVAVAGFLCETTTGQVVWSGHTTLNDATPDAQFAQKLAASLLRSAPKRPASRG